MMNYIVPNSPQQIELISGFAMKPDSTRLAVCGTRNGLAKKSYLFVVNTDHGMVDSKIIRFRHNELDDTAEWLLGGMLWNTEDDLHMVWWNPGVGPASGAERNNDDT